MLNRQRRLTVAILLLAAALRLPLAFVEMIHHSDELWQYLEPAYGLVTGRWVMTWEYREGMRSWLLPTLLAGPMWLGKALAPGTALYLWLPRIAAVLCSLAIVGFGTVIAARLSRLHAIVVGLILATSFELVYFSARTLSDTFAVAAFVPAAWAVLPHPKRSSRRLLAGGLLLGLVVATRFQLAPAAALFAALCCGRDRRAWVAVALGGLAGLAIDGAIDAAHGAMPLAWMAENLRLNLIEGKSEHYGTEPGWWFVANQLRLWGAAAGAMLLLAALGARRQPILLIVALANIAIHSLIPHKEYRFVWLSSVLLILLAGIGTAEAIVWARARWPRRGGTIAAAAILCWAGIGVATATSKAGRAQWKGSGRSIALMRAEHRAAPGCGVAYYRPNGDERASYAYFDRPARIAFLDQASAADDLKRYGGTFDRIVTAPENAAALDPAYRLETCRYRASVPAAERQSAQVCLYARPGPCAGTMPARLDVNAAFVRERR